MAGRYGDDKRLFQQLAVANNNRDDKAYNLIRDCFDEEFRKRLPTTLLPWDDITADELNELTELVVEKEILEDTGNYQMPKRAVKIIVKSMAALFNSRLWRKRLWVKR